MKVSPKYKRFKRGDIVSDTFTLPMVRSSIIRTIEGYHSHANMDDLKRLEKEAQNKKILPQKTDRILSIYDRAIWSFLHLIIEMILILVYYSYATKYHKPSSMFIPSYQCSNVYIDVEKGTLMNKDIQ